MSLKHLSNNDLVESTKRALNILSKAEVNVLRHFQEIEERRLWTGVGSLYKYIAVTFGLTADQIYPRLQAMRLMRVVPEVEQKIEEGVLSVTNALKAQQAFNWESKERLVCLEEKRQVLEALSHASTKEADRLLAHKYPETQKPPEKIKPLAQNQNLIQFYVDDETLKQIEDLKAKYSHQMPSGKMEDLIKILIQHDNRQAKPRKRVTIKKRSRHIPAEVKREFEKTRDLGCDHFIEETGARCGSKHFLQLDHIHEYCRGGTNEVHNLRWMCGFHNRHRFKTGSGVSSGEVAEF